MFNITDNPSDWIINYVFSISLGAVFIMLVIRRTYTYFENNSIHCVQPPSFPTGNIGPVHRAEIPIYIQLWKFYQKLKKKNLKLAGFYCYFHPCIIVADKHIIKKILNPTSQDFGVLQHSHISDPSSYYTLSECCDEMTEVIINAVLPCLDRTNLMEGDSRALKSTEEIYEIVNEINRTMLSILFDFEDGRRMSFGDFCMLTADYYSSRFMHKLKLLTSTYPRLDFNNAGSYTQERWNKNILKYLKLERVREKCAKFKTVDEALENVCVEGMVLTHYLVMKKQSDAEIVQIYCKLLQYVRLTEYVITFALKEMYAQPAIEKKLREEIEALVIPKHKLSEPKLDEMKYLDAFACETLRKYPINPFYVRRALHDTEIDNVVLRKDQFVFVPTMAIQRDRDNYPNPHYFNPERFLEKDSVDPLKYFPCASSREFRIVKTLLKAHIYKIIRMNVTFERYEDDISIKTYSNISYFLSFNQFDESRSELDE